MFRAMLSLALVASVCADSSIYSIVSSNKDLSTLAKALAARPALVKALSGAGAFTLFAPSDTAFASGNMADYKVRFLLDSANSDALDKLLKYHATPKSLKTGDLADGETIPTLFSGHNLFVDQSSSLSIHDETCAKARITSKDIKASNGMVQIVDTVFVPPGVFCPDTLFVAEQRKESRISSLGYDCRRKDTPELLVQGETKPVGLTADTKAGKLFWSNDYDYPHQGNVSWITSSSLNGTDKTRILRDIVDPQGLTVDPAAKKLYFTEHSGYRVSRSNYDGSDVEVLIERPGDVSFQPADVAIDVANDFMFVTAEKSPQNINGTLYQMHLNGSNATAILKGLNQNYGLCVDPKQMHVYAIQGGHGGHINCIAYGKTPCVKDIVADILEYPYMCAVDSVWAKYGGPTRILFTQANIPGQLYTVDSTGENLKELPLLADTLAAPMGLEFGCSA